MRRLGMVGASRKGGKAVKLPSTLGTVVIVFLSLVVFGFTILGDEIKLIDVPDGRIYQRDADHQYDLLVEGTYTGDPTAVEARVVEYGSDEAVVPWATIRTTPMGGEFSGMLEDIPQGGWYALQVRFADNPSCFATGQNRFGVGVLVACTGQSHIDLWFEVYMSGPGDAGYALPVTDELTRMYRHEQAFQLGPPWTGWQPITGVGATVFANTLREALDVPVGLLDYGVSGSALWQRNTVDLAAMGLEGVLGPMGWWLPDESGLLPEQDNCAVFQEGLSTIGNSLEALLWVQGHTDAVADESTENYQAGLKELVSRMRVDSGVDDLPVFVSLVTRQGANLIFPLITDESIQAVRNAEIRYCEEDPHAYIGCTTIDLPLSFDNLHHSRTGQAMHARRLAQAVLHVLLNSGEYTYHRGPQLSRYEIVDATTIAVHITHSGGSDFTPTSEIAGFEVLGASVDAVTEAIRYDEDTIRLTVSGDTSDVTDVRYLYGGNPGGLNLMLYAAEYVHDNSPLQLPLEGGLLHREE
jgi:hypothetical protein